MGIDSNGLKSVIYAKKLGVDFTKMAMIGRQEFHLSRKQFQRIMADFQMPVSDEQAAKILEKRCCYTEEFFRHLGAKEVHSFDNSNYEQATHIHDMNQPIPDDLKERYSLVLDSGSLEHVFNFPTAIRNCMEMTKTGGYFIGITPANDFFGHGFYQFSPELFFTMFTEENGFEMTKLLVYGDYVGSRWYDVRAPETVRGRVALTSSIPIFILVIARRISVKPIFSVQPQQSDYVALWEGVRTHNHPANKSRFKQFAQDHLRLLIRLRKAIWPETTFANRALFVPFDLHRECSS
jgi:hypothetical protein